MTMRIPNVDPLAKSLVAEMRPMMLEAVCREAAAARLADIDKAEAEIMQASIAVARAYDRLMAARFSGSPEADLHRKLLKANAFLSTIMRKHGRMPKGE